MNTEKSMKKRRTWLFWLIFWLISAILLLIWYVFLQIQNRNFANLKPVTAILPVNSEKKQELSTLTDIANYTGGYRQERTFLILFQNNLEIRPGGGFIGSFGIAKTKNGKIIDIQVFDTGVFDARIPNTEIPPVPLAENLRISAWKMRDSNWSPDFRENARKADYFYKLGGGQEVFDGVIAMNTDVLNSVLEITGPVKIDGYPGEYRDENAILQLEYQVEKGYAEQGIEKGERKNIMGELADILADKIHNFSLAEQLSLAKKLENHLKNKDIQFYFSDKKLQESVEKAGWAGKIETSENDYLMVVDTNLNALKSDYCIKRKVDYNVDMSGDAPKAVLNITYDHTCRVKDWMTTDYRDWLRVYVPVGSYLEESAGQESGVLFSDEMGKKVFGMKVIVPVGQKKTVTLKYNLPISLKNTKNYQLLLQKQSGSGVVPMNISVRKADGNETSRSLNLTNDQNLEL